MKKYFFFFCVFFSLGMGMSFEFSALLKGKKELARLGMGEAGIIEFMKMESWVGEAFFASIMLLLLAQEKSELETESGEAVLFLFLTATGGEKDARLFFSDVLT